MQSFGAHHAPHYTVQALCARLAHHVPHYTVQALRARGKRTVVLPLGFGLPAIVAGWTLSATSTPLAVSASTATTTLHSPTHRRLRLLQGGPSHDCQRASRKLSVHAVVWCASCTPLYCPGALRPRQACRRLTSRFRVAFYCRRVDLCIVVVEVLAAAADAVLVAHQVHPATIAGNLKA